MESCQAVFLRQVSLLAYNLQLWFVSLTESDRRQKLTYIQSSYSLFQP